MIVNQKQDSLDQQYETLFQVQYIHILQSLMLRIFLSFCTIFLKDSEYDGTLPWVCVYGTVIF